MKTIRAFVAQNNITASVDYADENKLAPEWRDANHYKVVLRCKRRQMTTYFSQGYGITGEPDARAVLSCLAMDSNGIEQPFEDWAADLGYDTDSRAAERTYNACRMQAAKLRNLLGEDAFEELTSGAVEMD